MSYCRFSTDDFQCDVYVYESCMGGWQCHVAGLKYVFKEPLPPEVSFDQEHMAEWLERHQKVSAMLDHETMVPLGVPHVDDFITATPGEMADRLEQMRAMGYRVPQRAIDALREEQAEMSGEF
jgi:hypothetical protein